MIVDAIRWDENAGLDGMLSAPKLSTRLKRKGNSPEYSAALQWHNQVVTMRYYLLLPSCDCAGTGTNVISTHDGSQQTGGKREKRGCFAVDADQGRSNHEVDPIFGLGRVDTDRNLCGEGTADRKSVV